MTVIIGGEYARASDPNKTCVVITVANEGLKPRVQASYPVQVIYTNDQGAIRAMPLAEFTSRWESTNEVYPGIADLNFSDLTSGDPDVPDVDDMIVDDEDDKAIDEDADDDQSVEAEDGLADFNEDNIEDGDNLADAGPETRLQVGPHPDQALLESNFLSFSERPQPDVGMVHELQFMIADGLTIDKLRAAFDLSTDTVISKFSIAHGSDTVVSVDWTAFIDVTHRCEAGLPLIGCVWLLTENPDDPVYTAPSPAAPAATSPGNGATVDEPQDIEFVQTPAVTVS